jgi:hypothetical protein
MAAPNKQPAGSRPGPKAPHEHAAFKAGKSDGGKSKPNKGVVGETGAVAGHGTPKPVGANKKNPLH